MKWAITIMIARNLIPGYFPGTNFLSDFSLENQGARALSRASMPMRIFGCSWSTMIAVTP